LISGVLSLCLVPYGMNGSEPAYANVGYYVSEGYCTFYNSVFMMNLEASAQRYVEFDSSLSLFLIPALRDMFV
jgi:hypothetical protein